ncbi:MAG TPA: squalene/phytoene synthase family protein [Candidatus Binatia bacterium]|nr:squalene/phytoene synthase family protein [Candidatus Binatia bacterium]
MTAPAAELTRREADALCLRLARRHYENFTVASLVVPRHLRLHLARIYAYCRTTDDLGDESGGSALWRLQLWQAEVEAMFDGKPPVHPVLTALSSTIRRFRIPAEPFLDLIAANVQDQRVGVYPTWDDLRAYCMLSAAPVGRMVLRVFEIHDPRAVPLSDDVCVGLQLANFAQDVAVDRGKGRTYLIQSELERLGLAAAVEAMCERAMALLRSGRELERLPMPYRLRLQLSLYRRGGEAIIEAVRQEGFRTDRRRPEVSTATKLRLVAAAVRPHAEEDGLAAAERYCQRMARREAGNFYWGFIALPRAQRISIYSLYDFARQVDDAADLAAGAGGDGQREPLDLAGRQRFATGNPTHGRSPEGGATLIAAQRAQLQAQRARLRRALGGDPGTDPVMQVLSRAVERHGIPLAELEELVSGVELDLTKHRYASWEELSHYCHLVAGVVGRMCVRIFGFEGGAALTRADSLGAALQLINILRDVREDAGMGRVYLPQDELARYGISEASLLAGRPDGDWDALVAHEAARARDLYAGGIEVCRHIPGQARACVRTMAGIYSGILDRIQADPRLPLRQRVRLSSSEKAGVMVRSWVSATAAGWVP